MDQQSARCARTAEQNLCELAARVIDVPLNDALREIQGMAGGEAGDANVPAHLRIHDLSADPARACGCATAKALSRFICSAHAPQYQRMSGGALLMSTCATSYVILSWQDAQ